MQRQSIVILGSGGFGREVAALLEDINAARPTFDIVGFLNTDKEDASGRLVDGYPIFNRSYLTSSPCPFTHAVLGVGLPAIRRRIALHVKQIAPHLVWPNIVHPSAILSKRVRLSGEGIIVTAGNILTTNIEIASFAMLNLSCTIGHDVTIGSYSVLSPGVNISGAVQIGEGANLGTGSKVIESQRIGDWSIVGAGSVITEPVPSNSTVVGVPGRVIKERPALWYEK